MDLDAIVGKLRAEERDATAQLDRALERAREARDEGVLDSGDLGVTANAKDEQLKDAEMAQQHLDAVQQALARVEAGTFGNCAADGEPIERPRLEAVPWAEYCLKHQALREQASPTRTTL